MFIIQIVCSKCKTILRTANLLYKLCPVCSTFIEIDLKEANLITGNFKLFKKKISRIDYDRQLIQEKYKTLHSNLSRGLIPV